jgi:enoyl reductase-like protein
MIQDDYVARFKEADNSLSTDDTLALMKGTFSGDWEDNKAVLGFLVSHSSDIEAKITQVKKSAIATQVEALQKQLQKL